MAQLLTIAAATAATFVAGVAAVAEIPFVSSEGPCPQLVVDGKPMILIGGELHNSNASTVRQIELVTRRVSTMGLNTLLAPIAWEQFEPQEGVFDSTLIDTLVKQARAHDLKLVILWFATWKNGQSSYAPRWVKADPRRFQRVQTKTGESLETLSPFCRSTREADAIAFSALMRRIREVDRSNTVVMIQPENEAGIFLDMDYSRGGLDALASAVPKPLVEYLDKHRDRRPSPVQAAWESQGRPTSGSWTDLFGDGPAACEFLLAWQTASFINHVAAAGQREHPLPMFVNAWIVQHPEEPAGAYPNGGPVARVMDIYKAAAPNLFTLAPDIYLPAFKEICQGYARDDNPLLIPESTVDAGRAFYAFAEHDAICYAPFGFEERAKGDEAFQAAYGVLGELHDEIVKHQGDGSVHGFLREGTEASRTVLMGSYKIDCYYESAGEPCYGLVIQESEHAFLIAGVNLRLEFRAIDDSVVGNLAIVEEVRRVGGVWQTDRVLNGDETYHHASVRVTGRERLAGASPASSGLAPQPTAESEGAGSAAVIRRIMTPGIYQVQTYMRPR